MATLNSDLDYLFDLNVDYIHHRIHREFGALRYKVCDKNVFPVTCTKWRTERKTPPA